MFEIGSSLREARTRQDLTFEEMEARTKVRAKYLRLLEEDRFSELPAHTYVKGFLKVYADELGLEGQLYVDEYNSRYVGGAEDDAPLRTRRVPASRARTRERREHRVVVVALATIAILTALVIAAWRVGGPEEQKISGLGSTPDATTPASKVAVEVRAESGGTYMEGYRGGPGGKLLYAGTLERGQLHKFQRVRVLFLSVAAPGNVRVKVNGNRVAMPDGGDWVIGPRGVSVP